MKPISNIQKGKFLENWIVERLRMSGLDKRAYRQKGSGSGLNKGDIWNDLGVCFEAKNQKQFHAAWFKQAKEESMGTQEPVVVWKPPLEPPDNSLVVLNWYFFEELLKHRKEPALKEPDKEMSFQLRRLKETINQILKQLL